MKLWARQEEVNLRTSWNTWRKGLGDAPRRGVSVGVSFAFWGLLVMPALWPAHWLAGPHQWLPGPREWVLPGLVLSLLLHGILVCLRQRGLQPLVPPALMLWSAGLWTLVLSLSAASGSATALGLGTQACWPVLIWLGWWMAGDVTAVTMAARAIGIGSLTIGSIALSQLYGIEVWPRSDSFPDRIVSVFSNPNHLGSFSAFVLPLASVAYLRVASGWRWLLCAVIYAALLLAGSRGAWVGAVGALVLMSAGIGLCLSGQMRTRILRRGGLLLCTWLVTTLALLNTPVLQSSEGELSVADRLQQTGDVLLAEKRSGDATLQHRLLLWVAASSMIRQSPAFGVGPGGFESAYQQLRPTLRQRAEFQRLSPGQQSDRPRFAHNEPLHVAAETGGLGLIALAGCVFVPLFFGVRGALRGPDLLWCQGGIAAVATVLIHGLVSYPLHMPMTAYPLFLVLGILLKMPSSAHLFTIFKKTVDS